MKTLWERSKASGLSRRRFLQLLSAGGASAVLAACGREPEAGQEARAGVAKSGQVPWVKDPAPFIQHATNLETRLELLQGFITPNDLFFVRNHAPTPRIDLQDYRLRIEGDGVEPPVDLTYDDILRLPRRSVIAYLECAGNWRSFFGKVMGQNARGGQWATGGVGCATWTGTSLRTVLSLAGVKRGAVDVNLIGLDEGGFERPMPIEKAMESETLLAYAMNGETLPPDHGFPVRAVLPGWVASSSIKWLGRIVVSTEKIWVRNNTTSYVLIGSEWPPERYAPAQGGPITTQSVKSAIALPRPAVLSAGPRLIGGFAYSPHGRIARVEWSADEGGAWRSAGLVEPILQHAWVRFEFIWNATAGSHLLMVRATDERGNTQPETIPFNEKGYLLNVPIPHPVEVT